MCALRQHWFFKINVTMLMTNYAFFTLFVILLFKYAESECLSALNLIYPKMLNETGITFAAIKQSGSSYQVVYANGDGVFTTPTIDHLQPIQRNRESVLSTRANDDFLSRLFMLDKETLILIYRKDPGWFGSTRYFAKKIKYVHEAGETNGYLQMEGIKILHPDDVKLFRMAASTEDVFQFASSRCLSIFTDTASASNIPICNTKIQVKGKTAPPDVVCREIFYYCLVDTLRGEIDAYRRKSEIEFETAVREDLPYVHPMIHYKRAGNSFQQQKADITDRYVIPSGSATYTSTNKLIIYLRNTNVMKMSGSNSICVFMPQDTYDAVLWDDKWDPKERDFQDISFTPLPIGFRQADLCRKSSSIFTSTGMFIGAVFVSMVVSFAGIAVIMIGHAGGRRRKKAKSFFGIRKRHGGRRTNRSTKQAISTVATTVDTDVTKSDVTSAFSKYTRTRKHRH